MCDPLGLGGVEVKIILNRLAASGFSIGLMAPMIAIMMVTTPVSASSNDCNVEPSTGIDWDRQAHEYNLDNDNFLWWDDSWEQETELYSLTSDFYAEINVPRNDGAALKMELVTGYSYTFCIEFHPDPDNPPNMTARGDAYILTSGNWGYYSNEYDAYKEGWGMPEEVLQWVPVEWRDLAVFLPFRDTHAYENRESVSFSTALDNDNTGWISWFGEENDAEYYLVFDNWNNSRHSDANGVDGDMIVQVWVDVEDRLTLPKLTAYLIVGILPISCVIIPFILHSKYHSTGAVIEQEEVQIVPLLETAAEITDDDED